MAINLTSLLLLLVYLLPSAKCSCPSNQGGFLRLGGRIIQASQIPPGQTTTAGNLPRIVVLRHPGGLRRFTPGSSGRIYFWRRGSDQSKCPSQGSAPTGSCPSQSETLPCMDRKEPCENNILPSFTGNNILRFTDVSSTSLDVSWREWANDTDRGFGPVGGYTLKYLLDGIIKTKVTTGTAITINGLSPDTEYEFQLAVSAGGVLTGKNGAPTDLYTVRTLCGDPPSPVLNLTSVASDNVQLDLQVPPRDQWRCRNLTVKLQVEENGSWETYNRLNTSTRQQVPISALKPCSNYRFRVLMENGVGAPASVVVNFTTEPRDPQPPTMLLQPTKDAVNVTVNITDFEAWSCSNPDVTLMWKKSEDEKTSPRRIPMTPISSGTISTLIPDLDSCTEYQFQLNISSTAIENIGTGWYNITTTDTAPDVVPEVNLRTNTSTSLTFEWSLRECTCCGEFITEYSYILKNSSGIIEQDSTTDSFKEFTGLVPFSQYSFQVQASNQGGDSGYSSPVPYETCEDTPPRMATPFLQYINATMANVTWAPPVPPHGRITGYDIQYSLTSPRNWTIIHTQATFRFLTSLDAYSEYTFQVRAKTSVGSGNWSTPLMFTTSETVSGPPQNIRITGRGQTWITVAWEQPHNPNGDIKGYEIECRPIGSSSPRDAILIKTDANTFVVNITTLEPSTKYVIVVRVITGAGKGEIVSSRNATRLTTDLTPVSVRDVEISGDVETGFDIILPPLTQQYATGYVILIIFVGKTAEIRVNGTRGADFEIYTVTKDELERIYGGSIPVDDPPTIRVGVETDNGVEDPYIVWSDPIPVKTIDHFFTIILSVITFSLCFVIIVTISFIFGRLMGNLKRKSSFADDDSEYFALQKQNVKNNADRYIPLHLKIPESNGSDGGSLEKVKLGDTSSTIDIDIKCQGADTVAPGHDMLSKSVETFQASATLTGSFGNSIQGRTKQRGEVPPVIAQSEMDVKGNAGSPGADMSRNIQENTPKGITPPPNGDVSLPGTNDALVQEERKPGNVEKNIPGNPEPSNDGVNKAVVRKAVEKFKLGSNKPKVYSAGIYDGLSKANVKTSDNGTSSERTGYYHASYIDIDNVKNFRRSASYIEPDDSDEITSSPRNRESVAYNVIEMPNGNEVTTNRVDQSYIELDEEAMTGCSESGRQAIPSYMELDEEMMLDQSILNKAKQPTADEAKGETNYEGVSYIKLDEDAMAKDSMSPSADKSAVDNESEEPGSSGASYIKLDEEAMAKDNIVCSTTGVGQQKKKHSYTDTIIEHFGNRNMSDGEGAMANNCATSNATKEQYSTASYIKLDEEAMMKDGIASEPNTSVAPYIKLDEKAMMKDSIASEQNSLGAPYIKLDEEAMRKDSLACDGKGAPRKKHSYTDTIIEHFGNMSAQGNSGSKPLGIPRRMNYEKSIHENPFHADGTTDIYETEEVTELQSHTSHSQHTPQTANSRKKSVGLDVATTGRMSYEKSLPGNPFNLNGPNDIYECENIPEKRPHTSQDQYIPQTNQKGKTRGSSGHLKVPPPKRMSYERSLSSNPFFYNGASDIYDETDVGDRQLQRQNGIKHRGLKKESKQEVSDGKLVATTERMSHDEFFRGNPFLVDGLDAVYDDTDVVTGQPLPENMFGMGGANDIYDDAEIGLTVQGPYGNRQDVEAGFTHGTASQDQIPYTGSNTTTPAPGGSSGIYYKADKISGKDEQFYKVGNEMIGKLNATVQSEECYYDETTVPDQRFGYDEDQPEDHYEEIPAFSKKPKGKPKSIFQLIKGKQVRPKNGRGGRNLPKTPKSAGGKNFSSPFETIVEAEDDTYEELPGMADMKT